MPSDRNFALTSQVPRFHSAHRECLKANFLGLYSFLAALFGLGSLVFGFLLGTPADPGRFKCARRSFSAFRSFFSFQPRALICLFAVLIFPLLTLALLFGAERGSLGL